MSVSSEAVTNEGPPETTAAVSQIVPQTIVANLDAPRLEGISTTHFVSFQRARQVYEQKVDEKNKEPGTSITKISYKSSIERKYLTMMITAQWIEATKIEDITEEGLKKVVEERSKRKVDETQLRNIDCCISKVKMNMKTAEAEDRVWNLYADYAEALEQAGYSGLTESHPHISIRHIFQRIQPVSLKNRMKDIARVRKKEKFDENDFGVYIRELAKQAKNMDQEGLLKDPRTETDVDKEQRNENRLKARLLAKRKRLLKGKLKAAEEGKLGNEEDSEKEEQETPNPKKRKLPPCLHPKCDGFHYIKDCTVATENEKTELLAAFKEKAKQRLKDKKKGKVHRLNAEKIDCHSALFSGTFANGAVECEVLADQGSDTNLLSGKVWKLMKEAGYKSKVTHLVPPQVFNSVTNGEIVCHIKVEADVHLRIRHGSALVLRNVVWRVSGDNADDVIIGRPLLDGLGINNENMLAAACDRHNGVIDTSEMNQELNAQKDEKICSLIEEAVYHSAGGTDCDGLEEEDVYIDIGDDIEDDLVKELEARVHEARDKGLSERGANRLREILFKHKPIFD